MATPASPSSTLRVHGSSKLALGATTAALVTLASGGTAVLVSQATQGVVGTPTSLPLGALPADAASADPQVVLAPPAEAVPDDTTAQALHEALRHRAQPGRRTLTAPLVALPQPLPTLAPPPVLGPVPPAVPAATAPPLPAVPSAPAAGPASRHHDSGSGSGSGADTLRSTDQQQADVKKAAHTLAEAAKKAAHDKARHDKAGHDKAGHDKARHDKAGHEKAHHDKARHDKADPAKKGKGKHAR